MQPRLFIAVIIYIGSYLPLSIILLSQNIKYDKIYDVIINSIYLKKIPDINLLLSNPYVSILTFIACAFCFTLTVFILNTFKVKHEIRIIEVKHTSSDLMNYVLPYVVTFINLDYSDQKAIIGFIIFMSWLFIITYKSGQIIMNPLLTVFGWRLYDTKYKFMGSGTEQQGVVISKTPIEVGGEYMQSSLQGIIVVNGK